MSNNTTQPTYTPPSASDIKAKQDQTNALRFLLAQRKLHSKAKRWLGLRLIGMGIIGIAAPIVSFLWPSAAVAVGALASTWIFLSRTTFQSREKRTTAQAAAIQEQFDIEVFGMPQLAARSPMPTLEEISQLAGPDYKITAAAKKEKLLEWYPIDTDDSGTTSIAISQRANLVYSANLLKTSAKIWLAIVFIWTIIVIAISMKLNFRFSTIFMGVALPLLPAYLDVITYWQSIVRASAEREALSQEIQGKLNQDDVSGDDLVSWQTAMYSLRCSIPQVPNFIYKLKRDANEQSMWSVARQLSDRVRRRR